MQKSGPEDILKGLEELENIRHPKKQPQKRAFDRFVVRGEAEVSPLGMTDGDSSPKSIHIRDIGRGGIGFVCEGPVETGRYFSVRFYESGFVIAERAIYTRHVRLLNNGLYLVGGQFVADTALLILLGVDPDALRQSEENANADTDAAFIAPGEVA